MIFGQTSAPTGFTKLTDQDNAALRVVSGSASTGGSVNFTTAFASQAVSGSVSVSGGSVGNYTLSTSEMPAHTHEGPLITGANDSFYGRGRSRSGIFGANSGTNTICLQETVGGGGSHSHSFTTPTASFSGSAINLAVKYVDVIRASKD
jgi:hypothetical protein